MKPNPEFATRDLRDFDISALDEFQIDALGKPAKVTAWCEMGVVEDQYGNLYDDPQVVYVTATYSRKGDCVFFADELRPWKKQMVELLCKDILAEEK